MATTQSSSQNQARRKLRAVLLAGLPAVTAVALLAGHSRIEAKPQEASAAATEVSVAEVVHRPLHDWQELSGRLQAVNVVEVRPRVSGYVERVAFPDGARVHKGQLLFVIDARPFQAEVDRLAAEQRRAASDLHLAEANRARAERLIAANAISREEYERLTAAAASARAELGSASGALQSARLNLEFTEVRAPIDGRLSRAMITAGNLVSSDSLLTTLVSDNPVYAYFDADEQTYLRYSKTAHEDKATDDAGTGVFMGLVDENGYPHRGRLDFVDNQVDPATGTIRARAVFDNPDGRFTPGLFARVRLVGGEGQDTVLIEDRAIGTDLGRQFVLVLNQYNALEYRAVELGPEIDGLRVVRKGLSPGESIVVNGLQHVKPGEAVTPTRVAMNQGGSELQQVAATPAPLTIAGNSAAERTPGL